MGDGLNGQAGVHVQHHVGAASHPENEHVAPLTPTYREVTVQENMSNPSSAYTVHVRVRCFLYWPYKQNISTDGCSKKPSTISLPGDPGVNSLKQQNAISKNRSFTKSLNYEFDIKWCHIVHIFFLFEPYSSKKVLHPWHLFHCIYFKLSIPMKSWKIIWSNSKFQKMFNVPISAVAVKDH